MVLRLLIILFLATPVYAQSTRTLYTNSGNIGIGTNVPLKDLEIKSTTSTGGLAINVASVGDGCDSNAVFLTHANGTDASTTFTEEGCSGSAKTITAFGNAQIDTAQSKFGGASALFDGTGDYLNSADSADWNFADGDFTIDFWLRANSISASDTAIFFQGGGSPNFWELGYDTTSIYFKASGTTVSVAWSPSTATWYHVAVVRTGNNIMFFIDGTQQGTTQAWSTTVADYSGALLIGSGNAAQELNGWLDELRISKGIARWTTTFTPPSSEYTAGNSSPQIELKSSGTAKAKIYTDGSDSDKLKFTDGTDVNVTIDSAGNVGIGSTTVPSKLYVVGTGYFTTGLNIGIGTASPTRLCIANNAMATCP